MKLLLVLVSLTLGTAAAITTIDWMDKATAMLAQATESPNG